MAWDVDRADWRTFRLDRLTPRTPTGPRFTPREPPDPDVAGYTSRGVSTDAYRYRCRLTVHAPAEQVADRFGPTIAVVTALDEDRCEVVTGSDSLDEVAVWVGLAGFELTVHEPAELRDHLASVGALLTRASVLTGESRSGGS